MLKYDIVSEQPTPHVTSCVTMGRFTARIPNTCKVDFNTVISNGRRKHDKVLYKAYITHFHNYFAEANIFFLLVRLLEDLL